MSVKRPERRIVTGATKKAPSTLMDNQNATQGDVGAKKVLMTFLVRPEFRDEVRAYAYAHDVSMTTLIIEGLKMRMEEE